MNQTQNGGQWNLLGTFTLDPSLNPKVELSDQANGTVVADAVMVVPSGTSADRVTYTPTLPSAGTLDIYAKWSESHTRAETVTYTIHHGGGSTDMVVNQQQPSAGWFRLGAFTMSPGQNHRVEVEGALEGETVADAVRFVSAGTSAPGIYYVQADHLGSPQKMTDASQALVWDAVYTPFGQVHAITGTATNNQRFPGQYADAETGFNSNYFRDYDPTTGRYVQSDPIGLDGGLNTYGYLASHNPLTATDTTGLSRDNYVADPFHHGGPHIDRYNEHGQNMGRYKPDGTPLETKGKLAPKIPNSDMKKFSKAAAKLAKLSGLLGLACELFLPDEVNAGESSLLQENGIPPIEPAGPKPYLLLHNTEGPGMRARSSASGL